MRCAQDERIKECRQIGGRGASVLQVRCSPTPHLLRHLEKRRAGPVQPARRYSSSTNPTTPGARGCVQVVELRYGKHSCQSARSRSRPTTWRATMSGPAIDRVTLQDISYQRAWRVLAVLAAHHNGTTGRCDPSQELLAIKAQCSVTAVKRRSTGSRAKASSNGRSEESEETMVAGSRLLRAAIRSARRPASQGGCTQETASATAHNRGGVTAQYRVL